MTLIELVGILGPLLLEIAERVVIMYAGQVIEQGPTEQIRARPAHPYTRGLLGSVDQARGARSDPGPALEPIASDPKQAAACWRLDVAPP